MALADRLDAEVELGDLTLRVLPALHAEGTDLRIRHKGRRDVPPLISTGVMKVKSSRKPSSNQRDDLRFLKMKRVQQLVGASGGWVCSAAVSLVRPPADYNGASDTVRRRRCDPTGKRPNPAAG